MAISRSPLRYPGGKSKLIPYVQELISINGISGGVYVEPFAGGAAIAWHLLIEGHVSKVFINDIDPAIYAFWYAVLYHTDDLCLQIDTAEFTIQEWRKQQAIFRSETPSILGLAFATFYLNRTNRSGILNAGIIGGLSQKGNYDMACRFNKPNLISRIINIAKRRDDIVISNLDATVFMMEILPEIDNKCLINIDPPYYAKGRDLYQNYFVHEDHQRLFETISTIQHHWIVTYDDTVEIRDIYSEFHPRPFGLTYTAQTKRRGKEVMVSNPKTLVSPYPPDISSRKLQRAIKTNRYKFDSISF